MNDQGFPQIPIPILVIAGPTASGKTHLALHLAKGVGGELVGADSVQIYREFNIGSAKPSADDLQGIPHHLIDAIDPDEPIDAASYAAMADRAIWEVHSRGRVPIVVGGAGLWLRALLRGLVALPRPDPELRKRLEAEVERLGAPAMHARLASVDPDAAKRIHPNDALRIVRALEVHAQTGKALGALWKAHALGKMRYPTLFIVLEPEPNTLRARIESRVFSMLTR
ncbi:MAG: tRNA (adenosine(37)-N6)-dimethylallyltransferase MiaA, partial [Sandaracinaceae bacterium]|nr:tRNA (adenosine(37)-N6)-dimethylallyltransferase MiaA [Sandaracinaceae bacterium]